MKKGDIVLIPFPFTNLKGTKKRPAVVLYAGKMDIIVSFITSKLKWCDKTDVLVEPDSKNGLKKPSIIRTEKLATLDTNLVIGKLGALNKNLIKELDLKLKEIFKLK